MSRGTRFGFIAAEKTTYGVRVLCRILQINVSAFYDWIVRGSTTVPDADLDIALRTRCVTPGQAPPHLRSPPSDGRDPQPRPGLKL